MMLNILPPPSHQQHILRPNVTPTNVSNGRQLTRTGPPPYGKRVGWKPVKLSDYGDGGAFPEVPIAQYPLNMGRKSGGNSQGSRKETSVTSLQTDAQGNIKYDAVITQDVRKGQKVFTNPMDLVPANPHDEESLIRPTAKTIRETTEATRDALERLGDAKIRASRPRSAAHKHNADEPVYIRYTPGQQGEGHNSGAKSRIIRLHEMPTDPLEPPKFRHKKVPGGPPSPPVPVMHSPPRKITAQDQQNWKIPPCISNWKNIKGYTIPLDKRIAADGRGLQERTMSSKFYHLNEALSVTERQARLEVTKRAQARARIRQRQKTHAAEKMEALADDIRKRGAKSNIDERAAEAYEETETKEEAEAREQRDQFRRQQDRERIRQSRIADKKKRQSGSARDDNRDASERIALGQKAASTRGGEALYDARLFNQSAGMDSGFGADDDYTAYDKPLFKGGASSRIYKPSVDTETNSYADTQKLLEKSTDRFKAHREFEGTDESRRSSKGSRKTPLEFEKEKNDDDDADMFGLATMASERDTRKPSSALDSIGKSNSSMTAGSSRQSELGRSGRKMEFTESSSTTSLSKREEMRRRRLRDKEDRDKDDRDERRSKDDRRGREDRRDREDRRERDDRHGRDNRREREDRREKEDRRERGSRRDKEDRRDKRDSRGEKESRREGRRDDEKRSDEKRSRRNRDRSRSRERERRHRRR